MAEKTSPAAAPDIVAVIQGATDADLDRVDARIGDLERELDALRGVRKLLMLRLGKVNKPGPKPAPSDPDAPPRAKPGPKPKGGDATGEHRRAVAKYLLHCGVCRPAVIQKDLSIPEGSMTLVLDHPWFVRDPNGFKLSREGQLAAGAA
jgi:hypothetical protein